MKKALSVILAMVMVLSVFAVLPTSVSAENHGSIEFYVYVTSPGNGGTVTDVKFFYSKTRNGTLLSSGSAIYEYQWLNEKGEVVAENQSLPADIIAASAGKVFKLKVSVVYCQSEMYLTGHIPINKVDVNAAGSMVYTDYQGNSISKMLDRARYNNSTDAIELTYTFRSVSFPVNYVDIRIPAPAAGEKPSFTPSVSESLTVESVQWLSKDEYMYLSEASPFKDGYTYYFSANVVLADYDYYWGDNPVFTINGKNTYGIRNGDKYLVSYTFPKVGSMGEKTDSATGIKAVVNNDIELRIKKLDKDSVTAEADGAIVDAYEIKFIRNGETVKPTDAANVKIPSSYPNAKVCQIMSDGSLYDSRADYQDGYLSFYTYDSAKYLVVVPEGNKYDLWLGGRQVSDYNRNDILGDGKASFDPETNTLTLDKPTITISDGATAAIYSKDIDLTVKGKYTMASALTKNGIYVENGSLTLGGDLTFRGSEFGIYADKDVTIESGNVKGYGGTFEGVDAEGGNLVIKGEIARFEAEGGRYPATGVSIIMAKNLTITEPEDGAVRSLSGFCTIAHSEGYDRVTHVVIRGESETYIRGDVDKSGKVNVFDASYILKGTTGTKDYPDYKTMDKSSVEFKRADVDGSGTVNIFDAAIVLKHATGDKSVEKYGVGREVSE